MRIKSWKLYLESKLESNLDSNEDYLNKHKQAVINAYVNIFKKLESKDYMQDLISDRSNEGLISSVLDIIFERINDIGKSLLDEKSLDGESFLKNAILTNFDMIMKKWKPQFIKGVWSDVARLMAEDLFNLMRRAISDYAEAWVESEWSGEDVSKMSPSELEREMNVAIDSGNFKRLRYLSNFLKESVMVETSEILDILDSFEVEIERFWILLFDLVNGVSKWGNRTVK